MLVMYCLVPNPVERVSDSGNQRHQFAALVEFAPVPMPTFASSLDLCSSFSFAFLGGFEAFSRL